MANKTQQVLMHLKRNPNGITSWEAIQLYRATRLSAIIFNLRKMGHNILSRQESNKEASWVRYVLVPPKKPTDLMDLL